jgi:hypothetical protein
MRSIGTMKDAPLTFPTESGGCHPLWVLGHLIVVEGMTPQLLAGGENPAAEWGPSSVRIRSRPATRRTILRSKKSPPSTPSFAKKSGFARFVQRRGSRRSDAVPTQRPRTTFRDLLKGSVDSRRASSDAPRSSDRRDPCGRPGWSRRGAGQRSCLNQNVRPIENRNMKPRSG